MEKKTIQITFNDREIKLLVAGLTALAQQSIQTSCSRDFGFEEDHNKVFTKLERALKEFE